MRESWTAVLSEGNRWARSTRGTRMANQGLRIDLLRTGCVVSECVGSVYGM